MRGRKWYRYMYPARRRSLWRNSAVCRRLRRPGCLHRANPRNWVCLLLWISWLLIMKRVPSGCWRRVPTGSGQGTLLDLPCLPEQSIWTGMPLRCGADISARLRKSLRRSCLIWQMYLRRNLNGLRRRKALRSLQRRFMPGRSRPKRSYIQRCRRLCRDRQERSFRSCRRISWSS